MFEDPTYITGSIWAQLGPFLMLLWVLLITVIGFAGSLLLAHGIIPSLAASRDLPDPRLVKLRPVLYGGAAFLFLGIIIILTQLVSRSSVLGEIYDRWWY